MLRKYALTVVFLFVVCGAAAQLPDDEYYPYGTGYEQRTPIVLTDSSLFYRAIQTMPDLYGSISAFNLPYIALGRRGQQLDPRLVRGVGVAQDVALLERRVVFAIGHRAEALHAAVHRLELGDRGVFVLCGGCRAEHEQRRGKQRFQHGGVKKG